MNIVFFGSSQFALPALMALLKTPHKVCCVVTQPDKKKGRGLHYEGTAVKAIAAESSLKVYQPQDINAAEAIKFLKDLSPDLFIVISYGQLLSQKVLDIPRLFCLNVHASLLPKYRGAAPMNWAIINREKKTGITIIKMARQMDAGPTILQRAVDVNAEETIITLENKLAEISAELVVEALKGIEQDNYKLMPQDENKASLAPRLKKEDGLIDWNKPAEEINSLVRATLIWPGAFSYYNGKLLKIYKTRVTKSPPTFRSGQARHQVTTSAGQITRVSKEGIEVATAKEALIIQELQMEGKKRMGVADFVSGHRIRAGEILGKK
ncbi:MAG: methionyl-tRNA formyltransferase [Candidatus Omnitrophica bacterium]|nr:methionyl-tRNA formyltransferase [Candidatus Omnitrophota bacterium]